MYLRNPKVYSHSPLNTFTDDYLLSNLTKNSDLPLSDIDIISNCYEYNYSYSPVDTQP